MIQSIRKQYSVTATIITTQPFTNISGTIAWDDLKMWLKFVMFGSLPDTFKSDGQTRESHQIHQHHHHLHMHNYFHCFTDPETTCFKLDIEKCDDLTLPNWPVFIMVLVKAWFINGVLRLDQCTQYLVTYTSIYPLGVGGSTVHTLAYYKCCKHFTWQHHAVLA